MAVRVETTRDSKLRQVFYLVRGLLKVAHVGVRMGLIERSFVGRILGTIIYEIPTEKSGFVSKSLINEYGFRPSIHYCTEEHFYSRQWAGETIYDEHIAGKLTKQRLIELLKEFSRVHLVTDKENSDLTRIQNGKCPELGPDTKDWDWRQQYEEINLELVEDPGTMPRNHWKRYKVDGRVFTTIEDVAAEYDVAVTTARNRFPSKSKKWTTWIAFELSEEERSSKVVM